MKSFTLTNFIDMKGKGYRNYTTLQVKRKKEKNQLTVKIQSSTAKITRNPNQNKAV